MPQVQVFKSTDTGAPTFPAQAGSMIGLLDACLVNGYNLKTIIIASAGLLATATDNAHGRLTGEWLTIAGATQAGYNGVFKITVIDANTYTYTLAASQTSPATGTITAKKAPAGGTPWTTAFTSANDKAYRSPSPTQHYLRCTDTGGYFYTFLGYSTMSSLTVGTDVIISGTQTYKYSSNSATPLHWVVVTNGVFVIVCHSYTLFSLAINTAQFRVSYFGDFISANPADLYNFILASDADVSSDNVVPQPLVVTSNLANNAYISILRDYTNLVNDPNLSLLVDWQKNNGVISSGAVTYPDTESGGIVLQKPAIWELANRRKRGDINGLWLPCQDLRTIFGNFVTLTVTNGNLANRVFLLIPVVNTPNHCYLEISDTW